MDFSYQNVDLRDETLPVSFQPISRLWRTLAFGLALCACAASADAEVSNATEFDRPEITSPLLNVEALVVLREAAGGADDVRPELTECLRGASVALEWNSKSSHFSRVKLDFSAQSAAPIAAITVDPEQCAGANRQSEWTAMICAVAPASVGPGVVLALAPTHSLEAKVLASIVSTRYRRIASIVGSDAVSEQFVAELRKYAQSSGARIVYEELARTVSTDPIQVVDAIRASRADAVFAIANGGSLAHTLRTLANEFSTLPVFTTAAVLHPNVASVAEVDSLEGVKFVSIALDRPEFLKGYRKLFPESVPSAESFYCYASWFALAGVLDQLPDETLQPENRMHAQALVGRKLKALTRVRLPDEELDIQKQAAEYDLSLHVFRKGKVWSLRP